MMLRSALIISAKDVVTTTLMALLMYVVTL